MSVYRELTYCNEFGLCHKIKWNRRNGVGVLAEYVELTPAAMFVRCLLIMLWKDILFQV